MKTTWKKHSYTRIIVVCLLASCMLLPSCRNEAPSEPLPEPSKTTEQATTPEAIETSEAEVTESPSEPITEPSQTTQQETPTVSSISVAALKQKLDDGNSIVLVDIRTEDRYETSHIDTAISIPFIDIPDRYQEIPQDREIIVYTSCA